MTGKKLLALTVLAALALLVVPWGSARADVRGGVIVGPRSYYRHHHRPVIIAPRPVFVAPRPVFVAPRPVFVVPGPVIVAPAGPRIIVVPGPPVVVPGPGVVTPGPTPLPGPPGTPGF